MFDMNYKKNIEPMSSRLTGDLEGFVSSGGGGDVEGFGSNENERRLRVDKRFKDFIKKLVNDNLIEKYETRKLVYKSSSINTIEEGLKKGVNFELLWLKSKRRYYHRIRNEDEKRIEMLEKRLNNS